jgi:hypothetical protein
MKKLILFISLFLVGNTYGQTLDIVNNTSIDITVEYWEFTNSTCTNVPTIISITVPAGTSSTGNVLAFTSPPTSTDRFYAVHAIETSTGTSGVALLTAQFSTCITYQGVANYTTFSTPVTGKWTEDPGTNDVDIEFN